MKICKTVVLIIVLKDDIKKKTGASDVAGYLVLIFIIAILYMTMGIKTAMLMVNSGYATLNDASLELTIHCFWQMAGFLLF